MLLVSRNGLTRWSALGLREERNNSQRQEMPRQLIRPIGFVRVGIIRKEQCPEILTDMFDFSHPGVGAVNGLSYTLYLGTHERQTLSCLRLLQRRTMRNPMREAFV